MIKTDLIVIGAGPTGLFTGFEAGLLGMKCHLVDSLTRPGGQCVEIYPNKPIYDIPAHPEILAGKLVDNLMDQIKPFSPDFSLGEIAQKLEKKEDHFILKTNKGTKIQGKVIVIAGGLGNFEPRKPSVDDLDKFENKGIQYSIIEKEKFKNKNVIIAGGGDSALDWTIELSKIAKKLSLIHRRNEFRGSNSSVKTVQKLKDDGIIDVITPAQVVELFGEKKLQSINIKSGEKIINVETDFFIPLFGLVPKMNIFKDWGLEIEKNAIRVNNSLDYQTNVEGVYAVGDINTYPGKLKLILSGFHEAAVMCHSAYQFINPGKKNVLKYTTVSGINGFDGSIKKPAKTDIGTIN